MKKRKPIFVIDFPTLDGFGWIGFICFGVAFILIMLMTLWYDWRLTFVLVAVFLCGSLAGRGFERYTVRKERKEQ